MIPAVIFNIVFFDEKKHSDADKRRGKPMNASKPDIPAVMLLLRDEKIVPYNGVKSGCGIKKPARFAENLDISSSGNFPAGSRNQ
jgi:hypothetical protein